MEAWKGILKVPQSPRPFQPCLTFLVYMMGRCVLFLVLSSVLIFSPIPTKGFYVPGVAPVEFKYGDSLELKAVKMYSSLTQLPYAYYSLPFCKPNASKLVYKSENLGEVLRGDRIVSTSYEFKMGIDVPCTLACHNPTTPLHWGKEPATEAYSYIKHKYKVNMIVDNLPCVTKGEEGGDGVHVGYSLGYMIDTHAFINNHLQFNLLYHTDDQKTFRVVGCEIRPTSVAHQFKDAAPSSCSAPGKEVEPKEIHPDRVNQLFFTYGVTWTPSEVRWASRWDAYLALTDVNIHWFSIINSLIVVLFLTSIITMIIVRTLRRDIARYNSMESEAADESLEESGWKLVHGDVFRPPRYPRLFASLVGSGIQILGMAVVTIVFAMLGMLSPASRGALMSAMIFLYVLMGSLAGYYGSRLYRTMRGKEWKKMAFMTATLYPGIIFTTCFILNFFVWGKESSGAVPFGTMIWLLILWFGISLPLVYLGAYFGFRKPFQHPVRTNQIPRQVPPQLWYMKPIPSALMAGVLPFGAMFIELFFIYNALWHNQFYYMFGFLFLVFLILLVSVSQIGVVLCYFQLCGEDYHWWWRVLWSSGGSSIYMVIYAVYYFYTRLEITELVPTLLYFGYTFLMVITAWLLTAAVGFFAAYAFLTKIYAAVKID